MELYFSLYGTFLSVSKSVVKFEFVVNWYLLFYENFCQYILKSDIIRMKCSNQLNKIEAKYSHNFAELYLVLWLWIEVFEIELIYMVSQ